MPLNSYDIDFKKMIGQLLGVLVRRTKRIAWLFSCLKPIRTIHNNFISYTDDKMEEIKWNGQTIILEKLLIDRFGAGIYIVNNLLEVNGAFVGETDADTGFYIGEKNDQSQYVDISYQLVGPNFTVFVPAAVVFTQIEMEALINKYKLYGTTYEIVII